MKLFDFARRRAPRGKVAGAVEAHDQTQDDEDPAPVPTAASLGLMSCRHCAAVWEGAQEGDACQRCGTHLHTRKPQSLTRTWAFLLAACVMYIPANLLPVMITRTLFGAQYDTILSGVIYFWVSGAYGLAAIVFIASFLVPLFKLAVLFLLVVTAQRGSSWRQHERAKLYHIIEIIGRWSMLDIFVVAILVTLVQLQFVANVTPDKGAAAFGAVVVLTILATMSFDPRLIWDAARRKDMHG